MSDRSNKFTSSIARASVILTAIGFLSKGIGFVREIIYANNFGLSSEFDLFLSSAALAVVINSAIIYLCQHYFIPAYNKIIIDGNEENQDVKGDDFFNYTFYWFLFGGIILSLLLFAFSKFIIDFYLSSLSSDLQETGYKIFLIFLITIPINAVMSVLTSYMQANFNFIYPALSQILLNTTIIILVLFFTDLFQIFIIPVSFVIAYIICFIVLVKPVRKKLKFRLSHIFNVRYKLSQINILISLIFIEGLSLSYVLIDRYFIGKIPEGGISALGYALVIYSLPVSLFSIPLITTMFSKFSYSFLKSPELLQNDFKNALGINTFIIIPIVFILFFKGDFFLHIFYERGKFSADDTFLTHDVLKYYTISLIFFSTYLIIVKLLYSIDKYSLVLKISIIAFFLKIIFNILLVDDLKQNGLALSTSFIYIFLFLTSFYFGIKKNISEGKYSHINKIIYFIFSGAGSYLIIKILIEILGYNGLISDVIFIISFLIIYCLNSLIINDSEVNIIKRTLFSIFLTQNKLNQN